MELELKKLTKEFQGFKAVDDITLTMSNGVYGLLGVNGAGKTTHLLNLLREAYYVMEKIFLHWMANIGEFLVIYLKNLDFIRSFRFMII
jgi:ABC-type branched-subunit amino acid transport system ATPase component